MANSDEITKDPAEESGQTLMRRVSQLIDNGISAPLSPGLYIVATPIGNLSDITIRALVTLAQADHVFCEDTRHSRKLVNHFGIQCELDAYHDHNAPRQRPRILKLLKSGRSVALISDAGTPLVSDPGYKLVEEAREAGIAVYSVPGASAALAALVSAGLPSDRFFFEGFLPPKSAARTKRLELLKDIPATLIFYEAPSRVAALLEDAASVLGNRPGIVMKELTKLHEKSVSGELSELALSAAETLGDKGEFVILIGPPQEQAATDSDIEAALARALKDASSLRDAVKDVSEALGLPRNRVYQLALAMRDGD